MIEVSDDENAAEIQEYETPETYETRETIETSETRVQKRNNEITNISRKKINRGGPKFDEVWEYFIQEDDTSSGHYKARCYYCSKEWARGKPSTLKAHLANNCASCPENISKLWRDNLANNNNNYTRNLKNPSTKPVTKDQQKITHHFGSDLPLSPQKNN
ncbi:hypothetical protein Glove_137g5 [Diversispora epigaea]|uniref:BED-type domain-containing protein n=1 Tax=Diversispora epigaea TaxID=1348612 RepID=A0A397J0X5_9GLOM|nr:hypothetical protein Glove_137g5 [Diversispora epigaea]